MNHVRTVSIGEKRQPATSTHTTVNKSHALITQATKSTPGSRYAASYVPAHNRFKAHLHHEHHFCERLSVCANKCLLLCSSRGASDLFDTPIAHVECFNGVDRCAPDLMLSHLLLPRKPRGEAKKCRKVYGMEKRDMWCTACRWKKACQRFTD